jgi:predicted dehydrogenase
LRSLSCKILLPRRYRPVIESREELSGLADGITWTESEESALDLAEAAVVARRPADQAQLIGELVHKPNLKRLLLEKPLAPNPLAADRLLDQIEQSGKIMRMGYAFGFTDWGRNLIQAAPLPSDIQIRWQFRAHHYAAGRSNWKRFNAEGGGALRFYGIQLIHLLAMLGYDAVVSSSTTAEQPGEAESWRATLSNGGRMFCSLILDSNAAQACFAVETSRPGLNASLTDPFGEASNVQDRRVPTLTSLCGEFLTAEQPLLPSYRKGIALWQAIEDVTAHDTIGS